MLNSGHNLLIVTGMLGGRCYDSALMGYNLLGLYSKIMELMKWICPTTQSWVKRNCWVPRVIRLKP